MKKFFCYLLMLVFTFSAVIIADYFCRTNSNFNQNKENRNINIKYKKEVVLRCPTSDEVRKKPPKEETCITSFDETFTIKKYKIALKLAKKIKYAYRTQDFDLLANIIPYPAYINDYKNTDITIKSKEEFLKLDKNILMSQKIFNAIDENPLFWNWRGYMLGNGDIWFWITDGGTITSATFNIY